MPIDRNRMVTAGTRRNLIMGLRGKAIPEPAVDEILEQAARFAERVVDVYSASIAAGEVGVDGSASADATPIIGDRPPTALMYGRVQSGKTAAMVLSTALCLDNGFRIVVVLTANNVVLVKQTAERFKAIDGARVFSTSDRVDQYDWEGQEDDIAAGLAREGVVLVCAKDAIHLPRVNAFLTRIDASRYPAIVFDDEADAATPDTTLSARSSGRRNAPAFASTIYRRVIENNDPDQLGESIIEILPHSIYVQVTATPYVLLLQRDASQLRPNAPFLLEPGNGYCGGEVFFASFRATEAVPAAPIVLVADQTAQVIATRRIAPGLAASMEFFLVAAAAKARRDQRWPDRGYKHLSHPSVRTDHHTIVATQIEAHLNQLRLQLRDNIPAATTALSAARAELVRTVPDLEPLVDLLPTIREALGQQEVLRVNHQTGMPEYGPRLNFVIGGNILGRGVTIDDLLVTYYIREAQTPQMDTVWQHARMYGYRQQLMPFTRVYLPRRLALLFKEVHESEEVLREILRQQNAGEAVPIRIARGMRPTRRNATEPSALQVFQGQLNPRSVGTDLTKSRALKQKLDALNIQLDIEDRTQRTRRIGRDDFLELIQIAPVGDEDSYKWNADAIAGIVEEFREQYADACPVYVRALGDEGDGERTRGRLSGPEIRIIRDAANGVPTLALLYTGTAAQPTGWLPTLVMPDDAAAYLINPL